MSLLTRAEDFEEGQPIISGEVDGEFNQLYDALRGTSTNKNLLVRFSDASTPVLDLDQLSTGLVQRWKKAGVLVASLDDDGNFANEGTIAADGNISTAGQLISTIATGTAPLVVTSETMVENLNVEFIGGEPLSNIALLDTHKTAFSREWFVSDPSTFTAGSQNLPKFIVPAGTAITLTKAKIVYSNGSHTSGADIRFEFQHRTAAASWATFTNFGIIALNNTNDDINVVYEVDFDDRLLATNDTILCYLNFAGGTITERDVTISLHGTQMLT